MAPRPSAVRAPVQTQQPFGLSCFWICLRKRCLSVALRRLDHLSEVFAFTIELSDLRACLFELGIEIIDSGQALAK
jgi:hypothetical protein